MSISFNTAEMLVNGKLCPDTRPCFYIYWQIYLGNTSFGLLGEVSMQVSTHKLRIIMRTA